MNDIVESEFRSYPVIVERLRDMGWDMKSPSRGGQVYTQGEATRHNDKLKEALGLGKPEYVVVVSEGDFWVIEAKASEKHLESALDEAKERAKLINAVTGIQCRLITGVAGSPDSTLHIETHCLVGNKWKSLQINNRESTGFISPAQALQILDDGKGRLDNYDIPDNLFRQKSKDINDILHKGAFHKRNRAGILACLLLALAYDQRMLVPKGFTTLISDINARAKGELKKFNKQDFYKEIAIKSPSTSDNHVKNRTALAKSIVILRDLNIASTIDSGRDILGQCYEEFLTYANDAKEVGVVLTPRHITNFAAKVIDIQKKDIVFDPTCGTGGFLVAALDKVRNDGGNIDNFKKGNLHGVEQDPLVVTLAIVNMVFRGDGSSKIKEGDCLKTEIGVESDKVLMNPPFASVEKRWEFVDRALEQTRENGLLFAVLTTNTMASSSDGEGEITWRKNLLKRHTLLSVIRFPDDLFQPHVSQGTCGIIIRAHRPHQIDKDKVVWAILKDGEYIKTKAQKPSRDNMEILEKAIGNYIATKTEPQYIKDELDCSLIEPDKITDLSTEKHIGRRWQPRDLAVKAVLESIKKGKQIAKGIEDEPIKETISLDPEHCREFFIPDFFASLTKGQSGNIKDLGDGLMPLVTASKNNNGIKAMVDRTKCQKIYSGNKVTISDFGDAHYHEYDFAATSHVIVGELKPEYEDKNFIAFLCASINSENARLSFYRSLSLARIHQMKILMPTKKEGKINMEQIRRMVVNGSLNKR